MRRMFAAVAMTGLAGRVAVGGGGGGVSRMCPTSLGGIGAAAVRSPSALNSLLQLRAVHDAALSSAVRRELSEELARSAKPEQPTVPEGWQVERTPGKCTFTMKRNYEDEEVMVYYSPKADRGDTDNHEIIVMVTHNGQTLQVDVSIEEGELVLDNICFYPDAKLAKDETAEADARRLELYPGPKISELDDGLLDSFIKYLEKRGVNEQLGEFISLYSFWAEQQEYERWLDQIGKFVA